MPRPEGVDNPILTEEKGLSAGLYQGLKEKVHQPAEEDGSGHHYQKQNDAVFDLILAFLPADHCQHRADKKGVYYHGKEMTSEYHDFFPKAISRASRAIR